jgi:hypothetical protein
VEFDQPYNKDGKVRVPVKVKCLDPLGRLQKVGMAYWVGDKSDGHRPQGEKSEKLPTDTEHKTADLKYDPAKKVATGELEFPTLPADRAYWTQAHYTNGVQRTGYYLPGLPMRMTGPPVDRTATDLFVKMPRGSTRKLDLTNSSALTEFEEGEGQSKTERVLIRTAVSMTETVGAGSPQAGAAATLGFRFQSIDLKAQRGQTDINIMPKQVLSLLNDNIKRMEAVAQVSARGEIFRYLSNTRGLPEQQLSGILQHFSDEAMESLQVCSIPLPNKQVQPLETWETKKLTRLITFDLAAARNQLFPPNPGGGGGAQPPRKGPITIPIKELKFETKVTYTYLGLRQRLGKTEAVVRIEGKVGNAPGAKETAAGEVKGYAMVEIDTGAVVFAEVESDFEVDSSSGGIKKKLSGVNKYNLTRGSLIQQ